MAFSSCGVKKERPATELGAGLPWWSSQRKEKSGRRGKRGGIGRRGLKADQGGVGRLPVRPVGRCAADWHATRTLLPARHEEGERRWVGRGMTGGSHGSAGFSLGGEKNSFARTSSVV